VPGPQGPTGPKGDTGNTGSQGPAGPTGPGVAAGGTTGQVLSKVNATDYNTQWTTPAAGTVTSVTGTAPVVSSGGATPAISMPAATTSVSGHLTSTDWNTFNNKAPTANPTFTGTVTAGTVNSGTLGVTGSITASGNITAGVDLYTGAWVRSAGATAGVATNAAGTIYLRPNGAASATGQMTVDSGGNVAVAGNLTTTGRVISTANYAFNGAGNYVILSPTTAGPVYLRPNGDASATGQMTVDSAGNVAVAGSVTATALALGAGNVGCGSVQVATFSATGATDGKNLFNTVLQSSRVGTALANHLAFYNANGSVGQISTSASATAYGTSSDENLKTFTGPLSGEDAIAIIRADPARRFTWNVDGSAAVGWGAQTSYAISHDLAIPPDMTMVERDPLPMPGEADYQPWSMDQSRRTPYLWAALSAALDHIDDLEARLAALEAKSA
jgi:hypothetical protein